MIAVNTPITIQGQQCILMRDLLGSAPNDKYTSQEQGGLKVWYEEDSLRETRDGHPNTPVYGFWQTLIASGLIDTKKTLQFLYTADTRDFGYYLYSREGVLHTGSVFQGELQRLPGPAIADGITIADGEEITVAQEDLKLPQHSLRTHKERVKAAAEQKKKTQQVAFLSVAAIAGAGLLVDTGLAYQHEQHMEAYQRANNQLHMVEQTLDEINKQKLVNWPAQQSSLVKLYNISHTLAESKISGEISLIAHNSPVIEVTDTPNRDVKVSILSAKNISVSKQSADKTIIQWVNNYEN